MNKKNVIIVLLVVLGFTALIVGGTLAWFSDSKVATNIVKTGKVQIELEEKATDNKASVTSQGSIGLTFNEVVPGDNLIKVLTIKNTGSVDSKIRVDLSASDNELLQDGIIQLATGWTKGDDGFYYSDTDLKVGQTVEFIKGVNIPTSWDNSKANKTFNIIADVQAVQSENFDEEVTWLETFSKEE